MTRYRWPSLIALFLIGLAACHSSDEIVTQPNVPPGAMSYTGYDEGGRPVVRGWLRLDLIIVAAQPSEVLGEWELHAVGQPGDVGPQVGRGQIEGGFVEGRFVANLNPGKADDNVILDGLVTITGGPASQMRYEGLWTWNTFGGTKRWGTFQAAE